MDSYPGDPCTLQGPWRGSRAGVGNSFGFMGHIRDKLGIHGPVYVHVN